MIIDIEQPQPDELEITTLGPGPARGESIVVHLRNDEWIIIDSCKMGNKVLPLEYLLGIGVNCEQQVKMVICTHWHTDHIQGLPEILDVCKNAQFYISPVGNYKGYLDAVLKLAGIDPLGSNVWNILNRCLDALAEHNQRSLNLLMHNERFIHDGGKEMFVVGPSDEMYNRFFISLLKINSQKPEQSDILELEGNLCSIALSVNFNGQKAILGGDMEVGRVKAEKYNHNACEDSCPVHEECGWCDAIKPGKIFDTEKPYHFVKIPHHSSVSAYCPKMWNEGMVEGGPIATTTIFKCGQGEDLPTREMLELYMNRSKSLYITNSNSFDDSKEAKAINALKDIDGVEVLAEYTEKAGIIVSRWRTPEEGWQIRCFGEARKVDDSYLEKYHS